MATVVDLLRKLGKRASGEPNALAGPIVLAGAPAGAGPADAANLAQAGTRSSLALLGHGAAVHPFLAATVVARLRAQPEATALWILPDERARGAAIRAAAREAGIGVLDTAGATRITPSRLVLTTPLQLHRRLLYAHDRAWSWLWRRQEYLALPELQLYAGAQAAHLRWLLRRTARLREQAGAAEAPVLAASLAPVANAEAALAMVTDQGRLVQGRVRMLRLDDRPAHATLVALWRCGPDREAELTRLVAELSAHKLHADILDVAGVPRSTRALGSAAAHVAVVARVPRSAAQRSSLLRCGYRLLVMLAGDEPHELYFAAHPDRLTDDDVVFPDAGENPYVAAPQLCCAAAELPLVDAELDRWSSVELRDRLARRGALLQLPGEHAWFARAEPPDPYAELDPRAVGGEPYRLLEPDGKPGATVPPLLVERAARPGTVVAPGIRVTTVDDQQRTIATAADNTAVATLLAASAEVVVRDELAARQLKPQGVELTRGRVTITQRLLGLRDLLSDGTQRRVSIQPPREAQWSAAACWLKLPLPEDARLPDPSTAGWSLAFAAPLLMLAASEALTPAYDEERRVLYLVETEPGGTGVAAALYERFEQALVYARAILDACARRPAWMRLADDEAQLFAALDGGRARPAARVYDAGATDTVAMPEPPRILRFPTRPRYEAEPAEHTAPVRQPRRRPAVYEAPRAVALAAEGPRSEAPAAPALFQPAPAESVEVAAMPPNTQPQPAAQTDELQSAAPTASPAPAEPAAAPEQPRAPDVQALIERMRRLRREREAQQRDTQAVEAQLAARLLPPVEPDDGEPRFHIGQRVQCLPYGTGVVRSSRHAEQRELVLIDFPDYGEIEVDSSVSLMRPVDDATPAETDSGAEAAQPE